MWRILLVIVMIIVSGCSNTAKTDIEKPSFIIQVSPAAAFSASWGFRKVGIVTATEEVTVSSLVAGRVTSIVKKIWAKVAIDQLVVKLKDTIGWNTFGAQKAAVGLQSAQDTYSQQQLALNKALFEAQQGYTKNQIISQSSKEDIAKQQEKLAKDLIDNSLNISGSNLNLQLSKLDSDLAKAKLDYQIKLDTDNQSISNFMNNVKLINTDLGNLFNDAISISDDLLGVTPQKEHSNDSFEAILGNKNFYSKANAAKELLKAIDAYNVFKGIVTGVNANTMSELLSAYQKGANSISELLFAMEDLLNQTSPWGSFGDSVYESYKTKFDALQSKNSSVGSSITTQLNAMGTFFATYKQNQESLAKSIDSLTQQIELSKKQVGDTEYNVKVAAQRQQLWFDTDIMTLNLGDQSASYTLEFNQKNNAIALDALQNSLEQAQIAYEEAQFNRAKFDIASPIVGTITDILVGQWEEVSPGTPLFTVVNPNLLEVELDITAGEKELVVPWQVVVVNQWGLIGKWIVESVSDVADSNFWYKVIVVLIEGKFDIGSSIEVQFAGSLGDNIVIPLNVVTVVDNGKGVVQVRRKGKAVPQTIGLGAMAGDYVIVTEGLSIEDLVITSDITNFDPEKMQAKITS